MMDFKLFPEIPLDILRLFVETAALQDENTAAQLAPVNKCIQMQTWFDHILALVCTLHSHDESKPYSDIPCVYTVLSLCLGVTLMSMSGSVLITIDSTLGWRHRSLICVRYS